MMISVFDRVENIVGKEENAGYQHFLLFPQCFQKAFFLGSLKVRNVWQRINESKVNRNHAKIFFSANHLQYMLQKISLPAYQTNLYHAHTCTTKKNQKFVKQAMTPINAALSMSL